MKNDEAGFDNLSDFDSQREPILRRGSSGPPSVRAGGSSPAGAALLGQSRPLITRRGSSGDRPPGRPPRRLARGFTLIELMLSMVLLAMIMGTIAMATQGASDAAAYGSDKSHSLSAASLALNRVCADLRRASSITVNSSRSVTVVLPGGEQRTYIWTGTSGDSLIMAIAPDATGHELVADVIGFTIVAQNGYSSIVESVVPLNVKVTLQVRRGGATTLVESSVRPRRVIS